MDKAKRWIDDNSVEVNAALNVLIVGSVAFGAVFQIVEVDSDISKGWTAWGDPQEHTEGQPGGVPAVSFQ